MKRRTFFLLLVVVVVGAIGVTVFVFVDKRGNSDRPRELAMTEVPPCELISKTDLKRLNVIARPDPGFDLEYSEEGTGCRFLPVYPEPTIELNEITNYGIDRWTDDDVGGGTYFEDVARIRGFRVIKVWTPGQKDNHDSSCRLYVDVADDQSLKVSIFDADRRASSPPVCEVTYQAAEAAMRTLTSR